MSKFGSREVANVVFKAKHQMTLGNRTFYKDEPVLYFDTLKTSGFEGQATTTYAQGGQGNPRLVAWEGDKTLTFSMEDALISQEGLAILAGAGLFEANGTDKFIYVHKSGAFEVTATNTIDLVDEYGKSEKIAWNKSESETTNYDYHKGADIFCMIQDEDGNITSEPCIPASVTYASGKTTIKCHADGGEGKTKDLVKGTIVFIDYYVKQSAGQQIEITPDEFAGSFYIEADTLFRRESDNKDVPAEFIIPNGKVQSNFNFSMSNSGDPSTFAFTVDALPGYTKFNKKKKVLACIQIIESDKDEEAKREPCAVSGE